jgi:hypothetical protein
VHAAPTKRGHGAPASEQFSPVLRAGGRGLRREPRCEEEVE